MGMASANVHCTNSTDKPISYANNSSLQKKALLKTRPFLEDAIKDMLSKILPVTCIKVADLGCASGPNTFLPTYEIMNTITRFCRQSHRESPELQVFLNDLPHNDFNNVFRSVPAFHARLLQDKGVPSGACFITGVAGSFHQRLFPSKSIHFVHSSYCLQWLSKVPKGVENNKGNIYISKLSPPNVCKAYLKQFQNDFSNFLRSRSEEMINGGRMLLTLVGRSIIDPTSKDCCSLWDLLAKSLLDLVDQGLVDESDVDSFNKSFYYPCKEEVREIIEKEGSFVLDKIETFEMNWDFEDDDCNKHFVFEKSKSGQNVADCIRAITESVLANHFGDIIIDELFTRYAQHISPDAASSEESDSGSPLDTQRILNVDSFDNINAIFSGKSKGGNDNVGEAYSLNSLGECELNGVVGGVDGNKKVVEERKNDFTDVIGTPITVNEEERRTINGMGVDNENTSAMGFNTVVIGQVEAPFEDRRTSPNDLLSFEPALSQNPDQTVDLGVDAANFGTIPSWAETIDNILKHMNRITFVFRTLKKKNLGIQTTRFLTSQK
ncbi:hypothetical protein V6N13_066405 [Hibiscus sabdariffa]